MATMTCTVSERVIVNGNIQGGSSTLAVVDVANVSKSVITCLTAAEVGIAGFSDAVSTDMGKSYLCGQFDQEDVRYIRITNLDATNHVQLTLRNSGNSSANEIGIRLDKKQTFILNADVASGLDGIIMSSTSALSLAGGDTMNNLVDIVGIAGTADVQLEVFIASK